MVNVHFYRIDILDFSGTRARSVGVDGKEADHETTTTTTTAHFPSNNPLQNATTHLSVTLKANALNAKSTFLKLLIEIFNEIKFN